MYGIYDDHWVENQRGQIIIFEDMMNAMVWRDLHHPDALALSYYDALAGTGPPLTTCEWCGGEGHRLACGTCAGNGISPDTYDRARESRCLKCDGRGVVPCEHCDDGLMELNEWSL